VGGSDLGHRFERTRTDCHRSKLPCLLDRAKQHLIVGVGVAEQLVVVDLADERNAMRVRPRDGSEHAERGRNRVAAAFQGQFQNVLAIEIHRIRREGRACRVLDTLIDRQD